MNRLTLICHLGGKDSLYRCQCGTTHVARTINVKSGKTKSCGCLRAEGYTTHGFAGTAIYAVWTSMIQRCTNPSHVAFKNYGGRGIRVCDSWMTFENFYADMGAAPQGMTLDRIDNSFGYSAANCCWISMKAQQNNKRSNVVLSHLGVRLNVTQWAEQLGIKRQKIYDRLRAGWSAARALT